MLKIDFNYVHENTLVNENSEFKVLYSFSFL